MGTWQVCSPASVQDVLRGGIFLRAAFAAEPPRADGADRERLGRDAGAIVDIQRGHRIRRRVEVCDRYWDKALADYPAAKEDYDTANWRRGIKPWMKPRPPVERRPTVPAAPQGPGHPNTPAGLYNGMIAPLVPYAVRGAIWYQGESNASEARRLAVSSPLRRDDRGLAQSLGRRRLSLPVRATGELQEQRLLAGAARIADRRRCAWRIPEWR